VGSVHLFVLEESTSEQEASSVSGGVVGETASDTEALELFGVSSSDSHVTLNGGVLDACEDALVG
jgi:hypothetical protein